MFYYGQKIKLMVNRENNEEEFLFKYFIFPKLNKNIFLLSSVDEYFLAPNTVLFSDVDRTNTDLLSKS